MMPKQQQQQKQTNKSNKNKTNIPTKKNKTKNPQKTNKKQQVNDVGEIDLREVHYSLYTIQRLHYNEFKNFLIRLQ